jgi:polar amino acid transport system substrate-binding protein
VKLELQQITAGNRIPYLITNKVDVVIAVMGLTPERAKQIMFTSPYADTNLSVFGPKSANVKSAADIGSLKVAAAKGTTQEMALTAMAPKANIMRTEDDATAAAAYLSGQAELFATNNLIIPDLKKRNPSKEFEIKFVIRRSPAHMGVRMGELTLVRWLDSFIFFNTMNGELDRLHQKWLGMPMQPMPSL